MILGELKHYGVVGMKWGVRKDRYVSKGTKYSRVTGRKNEPVDKRVKWVYKGRHDSKVYKEMGSQVHDSYYIDKYKTTKRLRKAGAGTAFDTWLSTTRKGSLKVNEVLSSMEKESNSLTKNVVIKGRQRIPTKRYGDMRLDELSNVNGVAFRALVSDMSYSPKTRAYNLEGSSKQEKYFETLKKKGYDAVVDLTDLTYNAKTATIILDPRDSLKKYSSKKKK